MTVNVLERKVENLGSIFIERWELEVPSLETNGEVTDWEPTEAEINRVLGVVVAGQSDPNYTIRYDRDDGHLHVTDVGTPTATSAGTDIGDFEVIVFGK